MFWDPGALAVLAVAAALCGFWMWLSVGVFKSGLRQTVGYIAVQLSVAAGLTMVLMNYQWYSLIGFGFPPLPVFAGCLTFAFFMEHDSFRSFFWSVAIWPMIAGLVVAGLAYFVARLRPWAGLIAFVVFGAAVLIYADYRTQKLILSRAADLGLTVVETRSFLQSLQDLEGGARNHHAMAQSKDGPFLWSYRNMTWEPDKE